MPDPKRKPRPGSSWLPRDPREVAREQYERDLESVLAYRYSWEREDEDDE